MKNRHVTVTLIPFLALVMNTQAARIPEPAIPLKMEIHNSGNLMVPLNYLAAPGALTVTSEMPMLKTGPATEKIERALPSFDQVIYIRDIPVLVNAGDQVNMALYGPVTGNGVIRHGMTAVWKGPQAGRQSLLYRMDSVYNLSSDQLIDVSFSSVEKLLQGKEKQSMQLINVENLSDQNRSFALLYDRILQLRLKSYYFSFVKNKEALPGSCINWLLQGQDIENPLLTLVADELAVQDYIGEWVEAKKRLVDEGNATDDRHSSTEKEVIVLDYLLHHVKSDRIKNMQTYFWLIGVLRFQGITPAVENLKHSIMTCINDKQALAKYDSLYKQYDAVVYGKPAYDFALRDYNGKLVHLSDFKGKLVAIDLWGTWCATCVRELPYFEKIADSCKDMPGIVFLSIAFESVGTEEHWKKYLCDHHMEKRINLFLEGGSKEEEAFMKKYCMIGVPRYFMIDGNGNILSTYCPLPSTSGYRNLLQSFYHSHLAMNDHTDGFRIKVGDHVPENVVLSAPGGETHALKDFKGKVVLLEFTASWCHVCREEMPHLQKEIWEKYKDKGLVFYGVDLNEKPEVISRFARVMNITYPLAEDPDGKIFYRFANEAAGVTRNILIDKNGRIVFLTRGFDPESFHELDQEINKLLQ